MRRINQSPLQLLVVFEWILQQYWSNVQHYFTPYPTALFTQILKLAEPLCIGDTNESVRAL